MKRKNLFQKLAAGAAMFAMAAAMLAPVSVKAADKISYPKTQVVYQTNKSGGSSIVEFELNNLPKGHKVFKVSSNSVKVAKPYRIYENYNGYNSTYLDKDIARDDYSYDNRSTQIELTALKTGKATISYRIGKSTKSYKTYKTKLDIRKYENPIKSLTITGVKDGKNLASVFKNGNSFTNYGGLKKNQSNAKFTITTAKDWVITNLQFNNSNEGTIVLLNSLSTGKNKASFSVGKLNTKVGASAYITLKNTKTGGTMRCDYYLQPKTK